MSNTRQPGNFTNNNGNFSLFGLNNQLTNEFAKLAKPDYSERELDDLARVYERSSHELAQMIKKLLVSVSDFRKQTDLGYRVERERWMQDEERLILLNKIGDALMQMQAKLAEQLPDADKTVLYAAFDYCAKSVIRRIKHLEKKSDKIFAAYAEKDNTLKAVLSSRSKSAKPF